MGGRWKLIAGVVAIAGGWLAFSEDPVREKVIRTAAGLASRAVTSTPAAANWSDVARKIGDFAAEERGLKDSVNRAEKASPPVAQ